MVHRAITTVSYITALNSEDAASCRGELSGDVQVRFFGGKVFFPCCWEDKNHPRGGCSLLVQGCSCSKGCASGLHKK